MADHAPAHEVFTNFYNGGGWPTTGLSCMIGLTSPIWCFIGPDAGAHMSEELKDASIQLPKAMMWSIFLNGVMGITMLITFCFCIQDVQSFVNMVHKVMSKGPRTLLTIERKPTIPSSLCFTKQPDLTPQRVCLAPY
jgi:amino acid transporter